MPHYHFKTNKKRANHDTRSYSSMEVIDLIKFKRSIELFIKKHNNKAFSLNDCMYKPRSQYRHRLRTTGNRNRASWPVKQTVHRKKELHMVFFIEFRRYISTNTKIISVGVFQIKKKNKNNTILGFKPPKNIRNLKRMNKIHRTEVKAINIFFGRSQTRMNNCCVKLTQSEYKLKNLNNNLTYLNGFSKA